MFQARIRRGEPFEVTKGDVKVVVKMLTVVVVLVIAVSQIDVIVVGAS